LASVFILGSSLSCGGGKKPTTPITNQNPTVEIKDGPEKITSDYDIELKWKGEDDKTPTDSLEYSYALAGRDTTWSDFSSATSATYSDLKEDNNYTFKVQTEDLEGNLSEIAERYFLVHRGKILYSSSGNNPVFTVSLCTINPDGSDKQQLTTGRFFYAEGTTWSPDGSKIGLWRTWAENEEDEGVYVMNSDGSNVTRIDSANGSPSWSPDGKQLAYFKKKADEYVFTIWIASIDGSEKKPLCSGLAPKYSPDGNWIAFTNYDSFFTNDLYKIKLDGGGLTRLTDNSLDNWVNFWSLNSEWIGYYSGFESSDLYRMNSDGTNQINLTNMGHVGGGKLSPKGDKVLFGSDISGVGKFYLANSDGSGVIELNNSANMMGGSFSPDGNWIAFN